LRTNQTLKGVSERLRAMADHHHPLAAAEFFAFCRSNPGLPDFIPFHFYPHDPIEEVLHAELAAPMGLPLHRGCQILEEFVGTLPNPDDFRDMLAQVMRLLDGQGLSDKELVLTEWTIRELKNDTVDKAA